MKKRIAALTVLLAGALTTGYLVAEQSVENTVRESLSRVLSSSQIGAVTPSPVEGISEVEVGVNILYVTNDGKYVLDGRLVDMETRSDLTDMRLRAVRLNALKSVGEKSMIVFPAKEQRHVVTVFTDIDCGYCRKLHNEMANYNKAGIQVRYLAYPRAGINSGSYQKAVSVWCSKDKSEAMTRAKQGQEVKAKDCDNPVAQQFSLAQRLGIRGTPAIVTEQGQILPGYVPADRLKVMLDGHATN